MIHDFTIPVTKALKSPNLITALREHVTYNS